MEKFNLNNISRFELVKPLNKEFSLFKCYVAGVGKNRNMSYISREKMDAALPTLSYAPVVGHLIKNEDGSYRLGSHDATFDPDTWEIVPLTVPVGVVVENSFDYEIVEEYGVDVEYLTANLILWTGRYPELFDCEYSEEIFCAESMEIDVQQYRPLEEDSNYLEILDFSFSALCLLGKSDNPELNKEPCFINSKLVPINFSADDFVAKFNELKEAVKECFNQKEGEANVVENAIMETEENAIIEETVNTEETTVEKEVSTEETIDYEAKYNDALSEIESLKTQIAELNASVESLTPYKLAAEKAEREAAENAVFSKFDSHIGEMSEYAELKSKASDFEIADLERECLILVGKFAMNEPKSEDVEPEPEATITFALDNEQTTKTNRYGEVYENFKTR